MTTRIQRDRPSAGQRPAHRDPLGRVPPVALVLTGVFSVQFGAGLAVRLFTQVPAVAVTALRLWTAAILLAALSARGLRRAVAATLAGRSWRDAGVAVAFGLTLAVMNYSFYQAVARIPLGIAVTVEFLGPLAVAVASSRRLRDLLWVGLAGTGVVLLARGGAVAGGTAQNAAGDGRGTFVTGLGFGLAAGTAWAAYIILSRATGRRFPGSSGLAIAMVVAAVAITPAGVVAGGRALLRPAVIATGAGVGLLSSIIPYSLELEALRRIPARVFGIWMSLEPAVAALVGLVLLGQALSARDWVAIGCVMVACAAAARSSGSAAGRGRSPGSAAGRGGGANGAGRSYHGGVHADLTAHDASPRPRPGGMLRRLAAPVTHPTPGSLRGLALASVVANVAIVATGAAVRLSNSGLGCLDWPDCTSSSLVAAPRVGEPMFHTWIEFGNRTLTGVLEVIAVLVFIAAWRFRAPGSSSRRRDLVLLAALQPAAIVLQAVVGGIVVLTNLNPAWVSGHFLLSVAVVAAAVALHVRATEGTGPARLLVRRELWLLGFVLLAVTAAMLAAGTIVTGTGPLAGAPGVPRYHLQLQGVTQFHADIGWLFGGVTFALLLGLRLTGAPARILRLGYLLLALLAVQGLIGYIQYFSHLPAGLVWVHESSAMLVWVAALRLVFALRDRGSVTTPEPAAAAAQPAPGHVSAPAS